MSHSQGNFEYARTSAGKVILSEAEYQRLFEDGKDSAVAAPRSSRERPQLKEYRFYDPAGNIPAATSSSRIIPCVTLVTTSPTGKTIESRMHCEERPVSDSPDQNQYESPHRTLSPLGSPSAHYRVTDPNSMTPMTAFLSSLDPPFYCQSSNSEQLFASPVPSQYSPSAGLRRDSSTSTSTMSSIGSRQTTPVSSFRGSPRGSFSNQEVMYESDLSRHGSFSSSGTLMSPSYSGNALSPSAQSTTRRESLASSSGSRSRQGSPVPNYAGSPSPAASARSPLGR